MRHVVCTVMAVCSYTYCLNVNMEARKVQAGCKTNYRPMTKLHILVLYSDCYHRTQRTLGAVVYKLQVISDAKLLEMHFLVLCTCD